MDMDVGNVGRRVKLILRQPNGQTSVFTGTIIGEDAHSYSIKTTFGEERTESKLYCSVEWLSPKNGGPRI